MCPTSVFLSRETEHLSAGLGPVGPCAGTCKVDLHVAQGWRVQNNFAKVSLNEEHMHVRAITGFGNRFCSLSTAPGDRFVRQSASSGPYSAMPVPIPESVTLPHSAAVES
jgi:hypothetical protein